jgi:hypothetical protein
VASTPSAPDPGDSGGVVAIAEDLLGAEGPSGTDVEAVLSPRSSTAAPAGAV